MYKFLNRKVKIISGFYMEKIIFCVKHFMYDVSLCQNVMGCTVGYMTDYFIQSVSLIFAFRAAIVAKPSWLANHVQFSLSRSKV